MHKNATSNPLVKASTEGYVQTVGTQLQQLPGPPAPPPPSMPKLPDDPVQVPAAAEAPAPRTSTHTPGKATTSMSSGRRRANSRPHHGGTPGRTDGENPATTSARPSRAHGPARSPPDGPLRGERTSERRTTKTNEEQRKTRNHQLHNAHGGCRSMNEQYQVTTLGGYSTPKPPGAWGAVPLPPPLVTLFLSLRSSVPSSLHPAHSLRFTHFPLHGPPLSPPTGGKNSV